MNMAKPLGKMRTKLPAAQGSVFPASLLMGALRENPNRRRSRIAIEPQSTPTPARCSAFSVGNTHGHSRIAWAKAEASTAPSGVTSDALLHPPFYGLQRG